MRLLVFASGKGSNFEAMVKASRSGYFHSKVVGLLCDKDCPAAEIAKANDIPVTVIKPKDYKDKEIYIDALVSAAKGYSPDYIILAGYMRIIPSELLDAYPLKVLNVHPSLLPAFPGKDSILRAWEAGVKTTGITVHFVNDRLDQGPIIAQESLIMPDSLEKLEEEMHKIEHRIYPAAVKELTEHPFDAVVVSKCLMGANSRYDGGNKYSKRAETFVKTFKGKVLEMCPEIEAGLSTPRPKINIINGKAIMDGKEDVTEKLNKACHRIMSELSGSKKIIAILKEKSPSCGVLNPKGLFATCALEKFRNNIFIVSEEDL
ncbi:MAG: phosphoribosylglycinamide formyltransferase [bacterium]